MLLFVLGLAARGGPYTAPRPTDAAEPTVAPAPTEGTPPAVPIEPGAPQTEPPLASDPIAGQVALVLVLLVGAVLLALGVRLLVRHLPRRLPTRRTAAGPAEVAAPAPLAGAVDRALLAVTHPAAREAVVRAWLLLGEAAAAAGSPASPAETATEYADRLAAEHRLSRSALHELAELYRAARFSEHPVGEAQRADARRVLTELRAELVSR